jgi:hypothetical protein
MNVSRHPQAIRILRTLLLAVIPYMAACAGDDIAWTDPLTIPTASDDARLTVDGRGRARFVADTSINATPARDGAACAGSVRVARVDDGTLAATWWSVRPDSSAILLAALSPDGGITWRDAMRVDTVDVATNGCSRPPPAIAASTGFVHIVYAMRGSEGVGVFYTHSMNHGERYEAPVTILYGDRLTRVAVAADKGIVAVAYEDPSGSMPQVGLAISRDWGHIFRDRVPGSTGVGGASNPQVALVGREVAVSWLVGSPGGTGNSEARATRIVRVGRLQ